jgi:hypothetical protein
LPPTIEVSDAAQSHHHRLPSKQLWSTSEQSWFSYLGGGGDVIPPHSARDDGGMVDDILLLRRGPPSPSSERLMDPMLL